MTGEGWIAPRGGGYSAKDNGKPKGPPPRGRASVSSGMSAPKAEAAGLTVERREDGEDCRRCDKPNVTWCAPSPLWNLVMHGNDINAETQFSDLVCIQCFIELAEGVGVTPRRWRVYADPEPEGLIYETPSGRVWDPDRWLWVEPETPGFARLGNRFPGPPPGHLTPALDTASSEGA